MLTGKISVITGANRGIGRAIALYFAKHNAKIVVNYRGSKEKADELIELIHSQGGEAIAIKADVTNEDEIKNLVKETIEHFGRIDVLVNNAGITKDNLLMRMSGKDFDDVINVNLKGSFYCLKYISNIMIKQKAGKIINLSSVIGITGNAGQANYAASKAGIIGLTKSAAKELASRGITVNAIAPGFIMTDMTDKLPEKLKEETISHIPLKRFGTADEIANAVGFLASDMANYITGQVIQVDGGMVI
ncbi:MAG TPA: 3-oxoacyl-[acyl-carrier-protein] reductase [Clostridiales bacterium]|nr:3-oxoacyl-[acyl-carrier-protein] reductase [Clostridiales bacterium]